MPAVMNAANEIAVEQFLDGRIGFLQIARVIEATMDAHQAHDLKSIAEVLQTDRWGRDKAREICAGLGV
jgi:1-deoxy-D-xylulose-5-phosphate reductoisomerase